MGSIKWTEKQEQAIYESGKNILVAAAAGSGKTAVLVERIIQKILKEKIDIDRLLVVTFTNAAASEMRERILDAIYKKLEDEPDNQLLQKQIILLNKSSICTIDSFCLDVIKNHFYELDISPNFRIGDNAEIELLKQEVLETLFEEKYESKDGDFIDLLHTYTTYKDDTPLKNTILQIYTYMQATPFPKQWLEEKLEMFNLQEKLNKDFSTTIWGKILLTGIKEEVEDSIVSLKGIKQELEKEIELEKYANTIENDILQLQELKESCNLWDKAYQKSNELNFATWPRSTKIVSDRKDKAKNMRDQVKDKLKKKLEKTLNFCSKDANEDIYAIYPNLIKLKNVIFEFDNKFKKAKKEKNVLDFNDIEHLALNLLVVKKEGEDEYKQTEIARKYQKKFAEIAIDEYQDSNLVQEYILNSISRGNNIFMVGDVKQSIYKFRQAKPELFLDKYSSYHKKGEEEGEEGLKIQLFQNFRSRQNILDFTNCVFETIMSSSLGDVDYTQDEFLNLGADYLDSPDDTNISLQVIDLKENQELEENENNKEKLEDIEIEAKLVAKQIKEMVENKKQVYDRKIGDFRDITYKDIVILLRSTKEAAPIFERELLLLDIPVFSDTSKEYLDSIEIQTILSILKVIDNPIQDIPLATVLRSSIGKFTDNELVEIRLSDKQDSFYKTLLKAKNDVNPNLKQKIEDFCFKLDTWRKESKYLALDELIWKIYTDTGYYNYVGLMPNGEIRQANLKMLFERAKKYESASFKGLFNFIRFLEKIQLSSGDLGAAKLIGENENVTRIMSIHKSKGLEFPVVFLSRLGKQFNLMDLNQSILLHQDVGLGVKYIDYEKQIQYDTLAKATLREKILIETLSEEMRILYVALTRAKEKLILTGIVNDYEKYLQKLEQLNEMYSLEEQKINHFILKKQKSFLDWILLIYLYKKDKLDKYFKLEVMQKNINSPSNADKIELNVIDEFKAREKDFTEIESIKEILNFEYQNCAETVLPTKLSVTQLKQINNPNKLDVQLDIKKEKTIIDSEKLFSIPNFIEEDKAITSAQKGTLVHLCMQKLDEKKEYSIQDIHELIEKMYKTGIITKQEANSIPVNKVYAFTKSNVWKELQSAKEIYKEKPFYLSIPAKDIYGVDSEEKILVQGVIDLYFYTKDSNLVLVDYKTDYTIKGEEAKLVQKYEKQLKLYKMALEKANNVEVKHVYIYSTYLEKEIEVKF